MFRILELKRLDKGRLVSEFIMLSYPDDCELPRVLHKLGVQYCMTRPGRDIYEREGKLTLEQFLRHVTPEALAQYDVTMTRLDAAQVDKEPAVVNPYEMETYYDVRSDYYDKFRKVYNNSKLIAYRLETQKANQHPVAAAWDTKKISTKALVWANEYVSGRAYDLELFIKKKLDEAANRRGIAAAPHSSDTGPEAEQATA